MFQDRSRDPEGRLAADDVVDDRARADRLWREGVPETELRDAALGGRSNLGDYKDEVREVTPSQIPEVGLKLMMHVIDEAARPIECDRLLPADQDPQQAIEADKMIEMSMRHEHTVETVNLSRR